MSSVVTSPLLKEPVLPSLAGERGRGGGGGAAVPAWVGLVICLLLAAAQVALGGYQLGVGNQAIQIAFLKRAADPLMYSSDPMVWQTEPAYPSYFFRMLAPLLGVMRLETLYLSLQLLTSFASLAAVYALGRSIFRSHAAGLAGAVLLVGGHLTALAGDGLYSMGFTHTYAALPLAVGALALGYRGKWVEAFVVAGLLFNIHALTAAYAMVMLGAGLLADVRETKWGEWLTRALLCGAVVLFLASPTLGLMLKNQQVFDADWVKLMRIRSAERSFPSAWWVAGDTDVPRFVLIMALFVMSWSFGVVWRGGNSGQVAVGGRITVLMTAAVMGLFVVGFVFTEIWPVPAVIRFQPFRASRLLLVLMVVHVAHGAVMGIRAGITGSTQEGEETKLTWTGRVAEVAAGVMILAAVGVPALVTWLPLAVVAGLVAALVTGRLSWWQAVVVMGALWVVLLAHMQTQFPLPLVTKGVSLLSAGSGAPAEGKLWLLAYFILLLAGVFGVLLAVERREVAQVILAAVAVFSGGLLMRVVYAREIRDVPTSEAAGLAKVSAWARKETLSNALFMTPTGLANFRISAERSQVGTWRDGTQLYFSAGFGEEWLERVRSLEPGLTLAEDGTKVLSRDGDSLETLDDKALVALAQRYGADYILLKTRGKGLQPRSLLVAHTDPQYTAYWPEIQVQPAPKGVFNVAVWNASEEFMRTTVAENIEKYRKADVTFRVMDKGGQPVRGLAIKADETKSAFVFGASLGFFEPNNISPPQDQKPAPARPVELQRAPEIFNGSMIPFSGKWCYIEPEKGKYRWSDMDKYVDYAVKNDWTLEFHHLSGLLPNWVEAMGGTDMTTGLSFGKARPELQKEFNRHCYDTVARYADRIKYWQVENEKYMMAYVPEAFKELQKRYPKNQFGISDCVRFWDGGSREPLPKTARGRTTGDGGQYKGADAVDWLIQQGIKPDFFSIHGHWPMNLWADPREMYNVIDYFAEKGSRVHISEELLQLNGQIMGPMRSGTLTPELQGEYIVRFFTVAFSHPSVDLANYWGLAPDGWGASNSGLIDSAGRTRPAWDVLKKQITEKWRSHVAGELSLEGSYLARVFHGTYVVTVTLADGKQVTAKVEVPEKAAAEIRLELDGAAGTLKAVN